MAILKKFESKIRRKNAPALPLRDLIIFPHMVVPLFVGRTKSLNAVEEAISNDGNLIVVFQKDPNIEDPKYEDIYSTGVLAKIIQSLKETTGVMKILVEVIERVKINEFSTYKNYFSVNFDFIKEEYQTDTETEALTRVLLDLLQKYLNLNLSVPKELYTTISTMDNPLKICDAIAGYLPLKLKDKGIILETIPLKERLKALIEILNREIEILEVQKKIQDKVVKKIEDTQRQYILTEQLKQIQRELGKEEETPEIAELKEKIKKANMPKNVEEKALEELNRLSKMMPLSPEATVSRTYIEWLVSLPWSISTEDNLDIKHAKKILDEDHYGLEKVKERILEYLAVRNRTNSLRGPILCFVGPPGVGKTSLGKSIARALGRKFVRVSLGGIRDEAEIRGHRRT